MYDVYHLMKAVFKLHALTQDWISNVLFLIMKVRTCDSFAICTMVDLPLSIISTSELILTANKLAPLTFIGSISADIILFVSLSAHRLGSFCLSAHRLSSFCLSAHRLCSFCLSAHWLSSFRLSAHRLSSFCLSAHRLSSFCLSAHRLSSFCLSAQMLFAPVKPLRNSAGRPNGSKKPKSQDISPAPNFSHR